MTEKYGMFVIQPAPPKKALSAFFLYRAEVYEKVKAEHPNSKITDLTKIISEMWNNVDEETKNRLEDQYQKNKEQVAKEKEEYVAKYGKIEKKKKNKNKKKKDDKKNESFPPTGSMDMSKMNAYYGQMSGMQNMNGFGMPMQFPQMMPGSMGGQGFQYMSMPGMNPMQMPMQMQMPKQGLEKDENKQMMPGQKMNG